MEPLRIVIADDEALIRLDLKEMLEKAGHEVVGEAKDGAEAVKLCQQLQPDLAVLDVRMPVMDGLEAAKRIGRARLCPVLMLTAYSDQEYVRSAVEAGAYAYLLKPFNEADVLPAIEVARSRAAEAQALEAEVQRLEDVVETRKVVERAKGLLMEKEGLSEPEAFRRIQRRAMDTRKTMREIAEAIVIAYETAEGGKRR